MVNDIHGELRAAILAATETHDRSGAVAAALSAVRKGSISIPDLYVVLAELLIDVGASWQAGATEVWREHFTTAVVRTIVEACHTVVAEQAAASVGRTVVLATPPDEYHDLGIRMVADRFQLAGWTAHLLGASVPAAELVAAARELHADAVVLSASTHFHRIGLKPYIDQIAAALPDVRIWVGGAAFAFESQDWASDMILDPSTIASLAGQAG